MLYSWGSAGIGRDGAAWGSVTKYSDGVAQTADPCFLTVVGALEPEIKVPLIQCVVNLPPACRWPAAACVLTRQREGTLHVFLSFHGH